MIYSFAHRRGAQHDGRGRVHPKPSLCVRLHEKGRKAHAMPCHHSPEAYLIAYLEQSMRGAVTTLRSAAYFGPDVVHGGGRCNGGPAVGRKGRSYE